MAPKRRTNKAPTVHPVETLAVDTLSTLRPDSGWRDADPTRVEELSELFYAGQWGMNVLAGISILKTQDRDGLRIVDDGLATVSALRQMLNAFRTNGELTPSGQEWPANIVKVLTEGLPCAVHQFEEDSDLDLREAWNAGKHDEECNRFKKTAVATFIDIASKAKKKGGDWAVATKQLLSIYGEGRSSTVYRWVRAAKSLHTLVAEELKKYPNIGAGHIWDNYYLLGTGAHEAQKLGVDFGIQALGLVSDADMSKDEFREKICRPLKVVEVWANLMKKRFGQVASKSKAFDRVVSMLRTSGGLKKVLAMCDSGTMLHGTSQDSPGIVECHRIVQEMEKCKAGGLPPPAVLPDADPASQDHPEADPVTGPEEAFDQNAAEAVLSAISGAATTEHGIAPLMEIVDQDLRNIHFHGDVAGMKDAVASMMKASSGRLLFVLDCPTSRVGVVATHLDTAKDFSDNTLQPNWLRPLSSL
jgi:hypothetical protein